ncbi:MAG: glycosyltransferase family 2 protein [Acidobacteriota bacterium]
MSAGTSNAAVVTNTKGISTIIVSHNCLEHVGHALSVLATQRTEVDEVIVVDNASTDGTPEHIRREFPWVRLEAHDDNPGFGAANNRGAAVARGDRLLLLNPDAWPTPGAITTLATALDRHPRAALTAPQLLYPDGSPQFAWCPTTGVIGEAVQKLRNHFEGQWWNHRLLAPALRMADPGWFSGACLLVRREAFEAVGGFDEAIFLYFEDVDLCLRLRQAGWRLRSVPDARVHHHKGSSTPKLRAEVAYRNGQLAYYAKHRPKWEQRFLKRKLSAKFRREVSEERRHALLGVLDEAETS